MNPINKHFSKVYVINMEKDVHRMAEISTMLNQEGIHFERFEAINGSKLPKHQKDSSVTPICNVLCTNSIIGCGLSHLTLWRKVAEEDLRNALILEDDMFFVDDYREVLDKAMQQLPEDWDIMYLGCMGLCEKSKKYDNPFMSIFHLLKTVNNKYESENIFVPEFPVALHAYAISNAGSKKLIDMIDKVNYHIDFEIAVRQQNLNIYSCHPNIAYQRSEDSNITKLGFPRVLNKFIYNFRDDKNFRYTYFFNLPIMQNINFWTLVFIALGLLAGRYKFVFYMCIFLFLMEMSLTDIHYIILVLGFFTSYYITHCKLNKSIH